MTFGPHTRIHCPCGLDLVGHPIEVQRAYDRHGCDYHEPDDDGRMTWAGVAALAVMLIFLSFICTNGWGLMR